MSGRFKDHILQELRGLPKVKIGQVNAMVCCPFHNDNNPSAGVCLDETGRRAPLGWFRCMGCAKSVPWNEFARATNLRQFKQKRETPDDYLDPRAVKNELLDEKEEESTFDRKFRDLEFSDVEDYDTHWRDIPTSVLKKLGCRLCFNKYTEKSYIWMPVRVLGKLRGYVKAELTKPTDGGPSYINAKGTWSNPWGLLFFDYAVAMMKRKGLKTLVLCEGPRDAIRLLRFGIPAVSVLGALNWSDEKRFALEQVKGLEQVILMMDGDDAGIQATRGIYRNIKGHFTAKYVKLWKYRVPRLDKSGKQKTKALGNGKEKLLWKNELDPFTAPKEILRKVRDSLV